MNRLFTLIALVALLAGSAFGQAHKEVTVTEFWPAKVTAGDTVTIDTTHAGGAIGDSYVAIRTTRSDTDAYVYSLPITIPMASADGTFYLRVKPDSGTVSMDFDLGVYESPETGVEWTNILTTQSTAIDTTLALTSITRRTNHLANTYILRYRQNGTYQKAIIGGRLKIFQPRTRE